MEQLIRLCDVYILTYECLFYDSIWHSYMNIFIAQYFQNVIKDVVTFNVWKKSKYSIKFYCNNRNLSYGIGSNRYNYLILYTLVDSNHMNVAVHLVARPNGNFVDPIEYQSIRNIQLKCHTVQPNRHRPNWNYNIILK